MPQQLRLLDDQRPNSLVGSGELVMRESRRARRLFLQLVQPHTLELVVPVGTRARDVLGDGKVGEHYGGGLTGRELRYFVDREWAMSADDVLWRRSKAGLHLDAAQRARVARAVEELRGA